jgi:hypothetical protein
LITKYKKKIFEIKDFGNNIYLELSIKDLWKSSGGGGSGPAVTQRARKFFSIRKHFHNEVFLKNVIYNPDNGTLTLLFRVIPTYKPKKVKVTNNKGNVGSGKEYSAVVQFQDLNELFSKEDWNDLDYNHKRSIMYDVIDSSDVKLFKNDMSWLYQGEWKRLDEIGLSLYPFPNLPDRGVWQRRYGTDIYITKHWLSIFPIVKFNYNKLIRAIDKALK